MSARGRHWLFAACCAGFALANIQMLRQLMQFSLKYEFATMIPLIPFLSAALVLRKRDRIFAEVGSSALLGGSLIVAGSAVLIWAGLAGLASFGGNALSIKAAAFVSLVFGGFLVSYGWEPFKQALFPLLMLLFMIPIPEAWLGAITSLLLRGSAEATALLLSITGTPFHRQGSLFMLPGITMEIAPQCSGIRSSLALLISCLLAGHLMLRTTPRKFVFILFVLPMAMFKNAVRIVTLSLLAIHLDKTWLTGSDLHRKGGVVFFVLTLLLMWPILWLLRRWERRSNPMNRVLQPLSPRGELESSKTRRL